jgi:predicted MFS family arabinose efflux permease
LAGFAAATWVVFTVFYPSYYEPSQVHKAMSSISFIVVISQFIGMSFSGMLVDEFGWKAPFLLSVIFSTVGFTLSFFIKETEEINKQPIKLKQVAAVLKDSLLLKSAFLSIVAHCMIFSTMFGFTSNYALKIGFETNELTWIVFSFMIPHALATLFIGEVLVPRFGKWKSLKASFLISSISILLFPIIHMKFLFFIIQAISGFFLGLIFPVLLGMSIENIEINKRATAMGAYQALYAIGIFAGPFFTGIINSMMGLEAGFGFVGILGVLATILTFIWGNTREKIQ